jgi:hypothetical protein
MKRANVCGFEGTLWNSDLAGKTRAEMSLSVRWLAVDTVPSLSGGDASRCDRLTEYARTQALAVSTLGYAFIGVIGRVVDPELHQRPGRIAGSAILQPYVFRVRQSAHVVSQRKVMTASISKARSTVSYSEQPARPTLWDPASLSI